MAPSARRDITFAPGMSVVVRRAEPFDLPVLVELAAEYCAADGHEFVESTVRDGFGPMLGNDDHGTVWMIDDTDGYAVVTWGWSIEIGGSCELSASDEATRRMRQTVRGVWVR